MQLLLNALVLKYLACKVEKEKTEEQRSMVKRFDPLNHLEKEGLATKRGGAVTAASLLSTCTFMFRSSNQ